METTYVWEWAKAYLERTYYNGFSRFKSYTGYQTLLAQQVEHWSNKPGVASSSLAESICGVAQRKRVWLITTRT